MFDYPNASANVRNGYLRLNGARTETTTTGFPNTMSILSLRTTGNVEASNFSNDRNIAGGMQMGTSELLIYNR